MGKKIFHNGLIISLLLVGFLFAGLILLKGAAIAAPPAWWKGSSEDYNQLVRNAEKEGKVLWFDSSDEETSEMIIQAFNKLYPKIKVEPVRVHGLDSRETLLRELTVGVTQIDVLEVSDELIPTYNELKLFRSYDWTNKFRLDPIQPNKEGTMVKIGGSLYINAYNTDKVSRQEAPKTWEDLLDPKWKNGKLGVDIRPKTWAGLWPAWGDQKMTDFLNKLAQQKPILKRGTTALAQMLAAGEFQVFVGSTFDSFYKIKMKGAPIDCIVPKPITPVSFEREGILAKAPNPNAAFLFLGWMASGGQEVYDKASFGEGLPLPGFNTMSGKLIKSKEELFLFDDEWLPKKAEFTNKATKAMGLQK